MTEIRDYPENVKPTYKLQYLVKMLDGSNAKVDGGIAANESALPSSGDGKILKIDSRQVNCVVRGHSFTPHMEYTWTVVLEELP